MVSLKKLGILRYRGKRGGKRRNLISHNAMNIELPVIRDYANPALVSVEASLHNVKPIPVRISFRRNQHVMKFHNKCPTNLAAVMCPPLSPSLSTRLKNPQNLLTVHRVPFIKNTNLPLSLCLLNSRSVKNKSADIFDYVCECKVDLVAVTETWLGCNDDAVRAELCPEGYKQLV